MTKEQKPEDDKATADKEAAVIKLATDTLVGDVRDFLLDRVKNLGKPWPAMSEDEQREQIHQAKEAATHLVKQACQIIAAGGKKAMIGTFVKFTVKDKIQCQIDFSKTDEQRHDLMDAQGMLVSIVMADAAPYSGESGPAEPTPDQNDLLANADKVKGAKDKVTSIGKK